MTKRIDTIDLLVYRLDTIEKRLDNMEKTLLSKSDAGSINTELLNIVLNMMRQQTTQQEVQIPKSTSPVSENDSAANDNCVGRTFMFERRKTIV